MSSRLLSLAPFLLALVPLGAQTTAPAIDLFASDDFAGWSLVTKDEASIQSICTRTEHGIRIAGAPIGYLLTEARFDNYQLHLEYRWPTDAPPRCDGGILLNIATAGAAPGKWPTSIQLQTKSRYAGDLLQMEGASFAEPVTSPAKFNLPPILSHQNAASEFPVGEWNTVDVVCQNGAIEVRINGVIQNQVTGASPASGHIGIQLEGSAFELRNVRIARL